MSRVFTDHHLLSWEAFASAGRYGLPGQPKIVFLCLSDPDRRSRFVQHPGDVATAQRMLLGISDDGLRDLLIESDELN